MPGRVVGEAEAGDLVSLAVPLHLQGDSAGHNNMHKLQGCLGPCTNTPSTGLRCHFSLPSLMRISLPANPNPELHMKGNSGKHSSSLAKLTQCKTARVMNSRVRKNRCEYGKKYLKSSKALYSVFNCGNRHFFFFFMKTLIVKIYDKLPFHLC